ncbi:hypothetical protein Hypma_002345 [Hypsizygus marmoreus]|uniref:Uncharacterized protein n=1 Tax=Hypsizygus marmoreus TaxID=39966 RepID=A0A369JB38_HYPMA|nr:hypothetical protein Hypma_002345 [Hypsizygus marmoreus]
MSDGDSSFHLGSTSSFGIEPSQLDQEIREQRERKRKRSNSDLECIEGQHKHSDCLCSRQNKMIFTWIPPMLIF